MFGSIQNLFFARGKFFWFWVSGWSGLRGEGSTRSPPPPPDHPPPLAWISTSLPPAHVRIRTDKDRPNHVKVVDTTTHLDESELLQIHRRCLQHYTEGTAPGGPGADGGWSRDRGPGTPETAATGLQGSGRGRGQGGKGGGRGHRDEGAKGSGGQAVWGADRGPGYNPQGRHPKGNRKGSGKGHGADGKGYERGPAGRRGGPSQTWDGQDGSGKGWGDGRRKGGGKGKGKGGRTWGSEERSVLP